MRLGGMPPRKAEWGPSSLASCCPQAALFMDPLTAVDVIGATRLGWDDGIGATRLGCGEMEAMWEVLKPIDWADSERMRSRVGIAGDGINRGDGCGIRERGWP